MVTSRGHFCLDWNPFLKLCFLTHGEGESAGYYLRHSVEIAYCIIALFGSCAYSRKTVVGELIENAGAPILCTLRLTSLLLYLSRGTCSLRGACAKKRDNTVLVLAGEFHQDRQLTISVRHIYASTCIWYRFHCLPPGGVILCQHRPVFL